MLTTEGGRRKTNRSLCALLPSAFRLPPYEIPNSFRESKLLDGLRIAGAKQLTICGAMSHMCIDATTRAAADLGFDCVVAHDACATRDVEFEGKKVAAADVHAAYMSALGFAYAKVMGTSEAVNR